MDDLISIIMPTYNRADQIAEAIESVREQEAGGYKLQLIVLDDGSTDNVRDVVLSSGMDIIYSRQDNAGKAAATRKAIELADGSVVMNLDPDDRFCPGKIRKVMKIFNDNDEVIHVGHPVNYWYAERGIVEPETMPSWLCGRSLDGIGLMRRFLRENIFRGGGSSFSARTGALKNMPADNDIGYSIDAFMVYWCLTRGRSYYFPEHLSDYRVHADTYSSSDAIRRAEMDQKANSAIERIMLAQNIPEDIKLCFSLRSFVSGLRLRELVGDKNMIAVLRPWSDLLKSRGLSLSEKIELARVSGLLKRSLPMWASGIYRRNMNR